MSKSTDKNPRRSAFAHHLAELPRIVLLALCACLPINARALEVDNFPKLKSFVADMAAKHGMAVAQLDQLFAQVVLQPQIIEAMNRPKEGLPLYKYDRIFVTPEMIRAGIKFWDSNSAALDQAQADFGVDPQIIVALLGIETHYGKNDGQFRVIDALTTLMLEYPQRSEYFRGELEQYLLLTRELDMDPLGIKGSYAGAIGAPQFMPSSYRRYAVDFDGDRRRNILDGSSDAIGSIANFLKAHGWKRGEPICGGLAASPTAYFWRSTGDSDGFTTTAASGEILAPLMRNVDPDRLAAPVTIEEKAGAKLRFCYDNFFVITSYNHSTHYAMTVYELARQLDREHNEEEYEALLSPPTAAAPASARGSLQHHAAHRRVLRKRRTRAQTAYRCVAHPRCGTKGRTSERHRQPTLHGARKNLLPAQKRGGLPRTRHRLLVRQTISRKTDVRRRTLQHVRNDSGTQDPAIAELRTSD